MPVEAGTTVIGSSHAARIAEAIARAREALPAPVAAAALPTSRGPESGSSSGPGMR